MLLIAVDISYAAQLMRKIARVLVCKLCFFATDSVLFNSLTRNGQGCIVPCIAFEHLSSAPVPLISRRESCHAPAPRPLRTRIRANGVSNTYPFHQLYTQHHTAILFQTCTRRTTNSDGNLTYGVVTTNEEQ